MHHLQRLAVLASALLAASTASAQRIPTALAFPGRTTKDLEKTRSQLEIAETNLKAAAAMLANRNPELRELNLEQLALAKSENFAEAQLIEAFKAQLTYRQQLRTHLADIEAPKSENHWFFTGSLPVSFPAVRYPLHTNNAKWESAATVAVGPGLDFVYGSVTKVNGEDTITSPVFFIGGAVQWNVNSDNQSPGLMTLIAGFSNFGFLIGRTFPGTSPAAIYFGVTTKIDGLHVQGALTTDLSATPAVAPAPPTSKP